MEISSNSFSRKILAFYLFIHFYTFIFGCVWYIWSKACTPWAYPANCYGGKPMATLGIVNSTNWWSECESMCIQRARWTLFGPVKHGCCLITPQFPLGFNCYWSAGAKAGWTPNRMQALNCTRISEFCFILSMQLKGFIKYIKRFIINIVLVSWYFCFSWKFIYKAG